MQTVFDWFMNFPFPWDNTSFTMFDYFKVCCLIFVCAFLIFKILLFFVPFGEITHDYMMDKFELGEDFAMSYGEYFNENINNYID